MSGIRFRVFWNEYAVKSGVAGVKNGEKAFTIGFGQTKETNTRHRLGSRVVC